MNEVAFLKLRLKSWAESLSEAEVEKLVADAQRCPELDRCFVYCNDAGCDYYQFLLLIRMPTEDFTKSLSTWLETVSDTDLRDLLDKAAVCGEQSFCMHYCGSLNCSFKTLIEALMEISRLAA